MYDFQTSNIVPTPFQRPTLLFFSCSRWWQYNNLTPRRKLKMTQNIFNTFSCAVNNITSLNEDKTSFKNKFCFYLERRSVLSIRYSDDLVEFSVIPSFRPQYNWHFDKSIRMNLIWKSYNWVPWVHQCEILTKTTDMNTKKIIINEINKKNINECHRNENKNLKIKGHCSSVPCSVFRMKWCFIFLFFIFSLVLALVWSIILPKWCSNIQAK